MSAPKGCAEAVSHNQVNVFTNVLFDVLCQSPRLHIGCVEEAEFLADWNLGAAVWKQTFEQRIEQFFQALTPRLVAADSFAPIFELGESRRREFRKRRLAEFRLTTPITNIPENAPLLQFAADGSVQTKN